MAGCGVLTTIMGGPASAAPPTTFYAAPVGSGIAQARQRLSDLGG
ncbi:MAG: hypothetical protein JWO57_3001, partial [Pseudonocardiales bacterium]|nr:hypothetical protein [Pseudonocardiales bacterium]